MSCVGSVRALLFVPANRPHRFAKAAASGTDAIILDLEDGVSHDAKTAAREAMDGTFTTLPIIVRVNTWGTSWHGEDLAAVRAGGYTAVMLPKAEDPAIIANVAQQVAGLPIIALIETARGLAAAREISACPAVMQLAFGSVDYCADMGCAHQRDVLLPARSELVLASRLAGIAPPLDGVTVDLRDHSLAGEDAAHARALGMAGKLCIHPGQIPVVKSAFAPTEVETEWARRVLETGDGAVAVDGIMVDEPVRIRARRILAEAR